MTSLVCTSFHVPTRSRFERSSPALLRLLLLVTLMAFPVLAASAPPNKSDTTLSARGYAVSISREGNIAVIGDDAGQVEIYYRSNAGWFRAVRYSSTETNTRFGHSVAISGDGKTVVVGDPYASGLSGAVYVYKRGDAGWSRTATLPMPTVDNATYFGSSVSIDETGQTIAVGSVSKWSGEPGTAFVFKPDGTTWTMQKQFASPISSGKEYFGGAVALNRSGTKVLVGAWNNGHTGPSTSDGSGAVYLYEHTGSLWSDTPQYFHGSSAGEAFGWSLAFNSADDDLTENDFIVGAPCFSPCTGSGAAYLYTYRDSVWNLSESFANPVQTDGYQFGFSVALEAHLIGSNSGGYYQMQAVIGAPGANGGNGRTLVWEWNGVTVDWSLKSDFVPSSKGNNSVQQLAGSAVAVSGDGNSVIMGAPTGWTDKGSTYIHDYYPRMFVLEDETFMTGCLSQFYPNANGHLAVLTSNGFGPYHWWTGGNFPPGLQVVPQDDGSYAWIYGQPTKAGKFNFKIYVRDAAETIDNSFTITINKC